MRADPWPIVDALTGGGLVVCWFEAGADTVALRQTLLAVADAARRHPALAGRLCASRSYCRGLGALALSLQGPVGIDVEAADMPAPTAAMVELATAACERGTAEWDGARFGALWVRKEAALKALGVGLALAPSRLAVGESAAHWQTVSCPWGGHVLVRTIDAPGGRPAAVAVRHGEPAVQAFAVGADAADFWRVQAPLAASSGARGDRATTHASIALLASASGAAH